MKKIILILVTFCASLTFAGVGGGGGGPRPEFGMKSLKPQSPEASFENKFNSFGGEDGGSLISFSKSSKRRLPVDNQIITSCNEGRFKLLITETDEGSFNYYAWDQKTNSSTPSLVILDGYYMETPAGSHYDHYVFERGNYTYMIRVGFIGVGGGVYISVEKNGKQIFHETCKSKDWDSI